MKIVVLASGSKGNLTYIETQNTRILVDVGLPYAKVIAKLEEIKIDIKTIDALLITHEHQDHIKGLKQMLQKQPIQRIYLTKGTKEQLDDISWKLYEDYTHIVKADETFLVKDIEIDTIMLSHDAKEPIGFIFKSEGKKAVLLTDTGYVDRFYYERIKNADLYILEANHDPQLLLNSKRPYMLKKRILSEKGHLSNEDASWLINHVVDASHAAIWVVAHISDDCNTPLHIEKALVKAIDNPMKIHLILSSQDTLEAIEL